MGCKPMPFKFGSNDAERNSTAAGDVEHFWEDNSWRLRRHLSPETEGLNFPN